MSFAKPKIFISDCLGFVACRYNGQQLKSHVVEQLRPFVDIVHICPEVEIGLGVPRLPIHLQYDKNNDEVQLIQSQTEKNVAEKMKKFSEEFSNNLQDIDGAILKSKSPSCGIKNVKMHGTQKSDNPFKGRGMFAHYLLQKYPHLAVEDEGRLLNYHLREIFLTQIFTMSEFRKVKKTREIKLLIDFHARHKYLFMRYHQADLKILGRIVAKHNKTNSKSIFEEYEIALLELFSHKPNKVKAKNVFNHIYGYFKDKLRDEEKKFFFASVEMFLEERIPFSSVIMLLKSRALQYQEEYILQQKILQPFPKELLELMDSGMKVRP